VVATILKNDRRSITLIHSSALLGGRRRSPADVLLERGVPWMKTGACGVFPGSSLVNPITWKIRVSILLAVGRALLAVDDAQPGTGRASSAGFRPRNLSQGELRKGRSPLRAF
jgi:hypothetical protein